MPVSARNTLALAALAVVALFGLLAVQAVGKGTSAKPRPKPKIIKVADDYFAPAGITVAKNKLVKWVWDPTNTDTHNVVLKSGPSKVKKSDFKSADGSIGIRFERRLEVPGTYQFLCTFHPTVMKLKITVKR